MNELESEKDCYKRHKLNAEEGKQINNWGELYVLILLCIVEDQKYSLSLDSRVSECVCECRIEEEMTNDE